MRINSWNSGAATIFGYETEEILGQHFEIIFSEIDRNDGIPKLEIDTVLKEGKALDNRWHLCKDGSLFYAYGLVFPLMDKDDNKLGYVKILKDLTVQKKSQDAAAKYLQDLEDLNTHKENVLAILSHDLRSPLAGIIGIAKFLESNFDTIDTKEAKEMLTLMHKSAKDELAMLDNLVEWARIKYASEAFTPATIELFSFVEKIFNVVKKEAVAKKLILCNDIAANITVFADKKMLYSILKNLVSNAIQHTPQDGKISICVTQKEDNMVIEVTDNGNGMPKEIIEKLFTPQLNTLLKTRENKKGAGIGLLLVKGFVEKNMGEIWVESTEGVGSSFYFTLPIAKALEEAEGDNIIELAD